MLGAYLDIFECFLDSGLNRECQISYGFASYLEDARDVFCAHNTAHYSVVVDFLL